ncbi:MAG: AtpZ/AtpI family protein [Flavobacteriaceae bacterium]
MSKQDSGNPLKKAAVFTGIGIQMGCVIFFGNYLGERLDQFFKKDYLETTITLVFVFIAMYVVISKVIKMSNNV